MIESGKGRMKMQEWNATVEMAPKSHHILHQKLAKTIKFTNENRIVHIKACKLKFGK